MNYLFQLIEWDRLYAALIDSNLNGFILLICFVWDFLPTFNLIVLVLIVIIINLKS